MVVTYYIKLFRTGADRHNGILMSLVLVAEIITEGMDSFRIFVRNYTFRLKNNQSSHCSFKDKPNGKFSEQRFVKVNK